MSCLLRYRGLIRKSTIKINILKLMSIFDFGLWLFSYHPDLYSWIVWRHAQTIQQGAQSPGVVGSVKPAP